MGIQNPDELNEPNEATGGRAETDVEARVGLSYTFGQLKKDPTAWVGFVIIGTVSVVAVIAFVDQTFLHYWLADHLWVDPVRDTSAPSLLKPPFVSNQGTWNHVLGTDTRGRDVLVRLFYGARIAIEVGFLSTVVGLVGGTAAGAVAGFYGGWIDDVLMRAVETLYAIPFLVLVIAFMTAFGRTLVFAMIGVGIISIPTFARLIRSRVVSVREEGYIEAARAAGVRDRNIILRHVIPNSFAPVLVQATLQIGIAILLVAGLSFLGFGAQPPTPSWGQILSNARNAILVNPWFSFWPGLAILVTVMGFNILGDGLRDALDPRIQN